MLEKTIPVTLMANNPLNNNNDLNFTATNLNNKDLKIERPRKQSRNRNMTPQEKLALIRECCEYVDKYCTLNKTKF